MSEAAVADKKAMTDKEIREEEAFLEAVRLGVGPTNAAIAVGWSPAKLRRLQQDPEFVELLSIARECRLEGYEKVLHDLASAGHFRALQMVLFNERSEKWKDVRHIQVSRNDQLEVGVVLSVKNSVLELLQQNGVETFQPGGALDVVDVESHELESG